MTFKIEAKPKTKQVRESFPALYRYIGIVQSLKRPSECESEHFYALFINERTAIVVQPGAAYYKPGTVDNFAYCSDTSCWELCDSDTVLTFHN